MEAGSSDRRGSMRSVRKSKTKSKALLSLLSDAPDTYTGSPQTSPSTGSADLPPPCSPSSSNASIMSSSTADRASPRPLDPSSHHRNPREAMRLAKLALMHDEVQEAEGRRERRRTRRASSLAVVVPAKGGSRQGSRLAVELSSVNESFDHEELSPTSSGNHELHSILRSPLSAVGSEYPSDDNLPRAASPALAPPPLGPRRRSSRVRFSEDPLPSVNSSPPLPSPTPPTAPDEPSEVLRDPSPAPGDTLPEVQPPFVTSRSSLASISSCASDPFGLQCSYGSPVSAQSSRIPSVGEDAFLPKDLPYRRLSKVLERLHIESEQLVIGASEGSSTGMSLRELIERPSLAAPSVDASRMSSISEISGVASTLSSFSSESVIYNPISRSSATTNSLSAAADILSRDNSFASHGSSMSAIGLPPPLSGAGAAYASLLPSYQSPRAASQSPLLNRQPWLNVDLGLSPRSGPSPIPMQSEVMPDMAPLPDLGERPEAFEGTLPVPQIDLRVPDRVARVLHADSIDMLPVHKKQHSLATEDALMALGIKPTGQLAGKGQAGLMEAVKAQKGHQRKASDFSVDLPFPLPPDRLNLSVTLANRVMPVATRKKATLNPAPEIQPIHTLIEDVTADVEQEEDGTTEAPGVAMPDSPVSALSFTCPSIQGSPCPDAYSLSAAVMQVGSPARDLSTLIPISHSPIAASPSNSPETQTSYRVPDSPKLEDIIEQTLRARRSTVGYNFDQEDSDLDTDLPLIDAAIKNRIVSPHSRLLRQPPLAQLTRPDVRRLSSRSSQDLRSGVSLTRGQGWSGSESEEEEWASTIRSIAQRRTSKPNLSAQARVKNRLTPARSLPSLAEAASAAPDNWKSNDWYAGTSSGTSSIDSEQSGVTASTSTSTTMTGTDLRTPSASLDQAQSPEDQASSYPWSGSKSTFSPAETSPPVSPSLMTTPKLASRRPSGTPMPLPTRNEEWGEPEVMIDEAGTEGEPEDGEWYWDNKTRTLSCESRTRPGIISRPLTPVPSPKPSAATTERATPTSAATHTQSSSPIAASPTQAHSIGQRRSIPVPTRRMSRTPSTGKVPLPASDRAIPSSSVAEASSRAVSSPSAPSRIPTLSTPASGQPGLARRRSSVASPLRTSLTLLDTSPSASRIPLPSSRPNSVTPKSAVIALPREPSPLPNLKAKKTPYSLPNSPSASRSSSANRKVSPEPTTPRSSTPEPDTLGDFVNRARAARKANNTPPPAAALAPTTPPSVPVVDDDTQIPQSLHTPRLSLGARLAELIAKRDAASAAGIKTEAAAGGKSLERVDEVAVPEIEISHVETPTFTAQEWKMEVYEPILAPAPVILMKGKQRQAQDSMSGARRRPPQAVCTASRFF